MEKEKTYIRYKVFRLNRNKKLRSYFGKIQWVKNKWFHKKQQVVLCNYGFHCSRNLKHAWFYGNGDVIAKVEVKGDYRKQSDKEVWQSMRILKTYQLTGRERVWGINSSHAHTKYIKKLT